MNKKLFSTILICGGFIIIGLVLGVIAQDIRIAFIWYGVIWILALLLNLGDVIGFIRSKLSCLMVCDMAKDIKMEHPPEYRIEQYVINRRKNRDLPSDEVTSVELIDTPGRRSLYPDERKREAIKKWDSIKQKSNGVVLEEFLKSEFGSKNDIPNVSKSSFYNWRRQLKKNDEDEE